MKNCIAKRLRSIIENKQEFELEEAGLQENFQQKTLRKKGSL